MSAMAYLESTVGRGEVRLKVPKRIFRRALVAAKATRQVAQCDRTIDAA
jgi:hypothetical protein